MSVTIKRFETVGKKIITKDIIKMLPLIEIKAIEVQNENSLMYTLLQNGIWAFNPDFEFNGNSYEEFYEKPLTYTLLDLLEEYSKYEV